MHQLLFCRTTLTFLFVLYDTVLMSFLPPSEPSAVTCTLHSLSLSSHILQTIQTLCPMGKATRQHSWKRHNRHDRCKSVTHAATVTKGRQSGRGGAFRKGSAVFGTRVSSSIRGFHVTQQPASLCSRPAPPACRQRDLDSVSIYDV